MIQYVFFLNNGLIVIVYDYDETSGGTLEDVGGFKTFEWFTKQEMVN